MSAEVASGQALPSASVACTSVPTLVARPTSIAIAPKAMAVEGIPMQYSPTNGVTQRDWVIPPRPKPGRKPATDTPPSKRKAQNRAAQRAFRERRAARLNELEGQVKQRDETKETALIDQVSQITVENNVLRATVAELRRDIEALQKKEHERNSFSSRDTSPSFANTFGSIVSQIASPAPSPRSEVLCLEEAFGRKCCGGTACRSNVNTVSTLSPVPISRRESQHLEMEIDFTNMFSRRSNHVSISPTPASPGPSQIDTVSHPDESCGFCSEGTACVCAEMASMEKETERLRQQNIAREAFNRLSRILPEPTTNSSSNRRGKPVGCTGEPGSCAQCQSDPMSTLFCRTLATKKPPRSSLSASKKKESGFVCCGGTACGKNGGEAKEVSVESDTEMQNVSSEATRGTYIPCSDAYLSLSRHKRFMDADLGTVVKKLNTSGLGVEVSSVKQVLEYLEALESFQNNTSRKGSLDANASL